MNDCRSYNVIRKWYMNNVVGVPSLLCGFWPFSVYLCKPVRS